MCVDEPANVCIVLNDHLALFVALHNVARLGFLLSSPIPVPGTRAAEDPPLRESDVISIRVVNTQHVRTVTAYM